MTKKELKAETIKRLKEIQTWTDTESAHIAADNVLCDLLENLNCKDVVEEYNKIDKWYS